MAQPAPVQKEKRAKLVKVGVQQTVVTKVATKGAIHQASESSDPKIQILDLRIPSQENTIQHNNLFSQIHLRFGVRVKKLSMVFLRQNPQIQNLDFWI